MKNFIIQNYFKIIRLQTGFLSESIIGRLYNLTWFKELRISNTVINYFDFFLLAIVIFSIVGDFIYIASSIIQHLIDFFNINGVDFLNKMVEGNNTSSVSNTNTTTTTIIHNDATQIKNIFFICERTMFIYGSGGYRLSLLKGGGTPGSRAFVICSTIVGDALSKVVNNTINDPSYVRNNYVNWANRSEGQVNVTIDDSTTSKLVEATSKSFIRGGHSLGDFTQELLNGVFDKIKFILEPVQVNYSNEVLANQIYDLSILLFVLSLLIVGLIIVLLLNIILYINMDRIINFFNNKFVKWYLVINKKFLTVEIFILGGTILYFMYTLITGIQFIATHPIIIN